VKSFEFRLARLAAVREIEERIALGDWARAETEVQNARRAEEEVETEIAHSRRKQLADQARGPIDPSQALVDQRSLDLLSAELRRRRERTRSLAFQASGLRQVWTERRSDRRALEVLEERDKTAYQAAEKVAEQLEMDETAALRWENRKSVQEDLRESALVTDDRDRTSDSSEGPFA